MTSLWKNPDFLRLWASQTLQSLAQVLLQVVVLVQVYRLTDSVVGAAVVPATSGLALFAGSLLASFFIERFPLRSLIHHISWIRAVLTVVLGGILSVPSPSIFVILLVLFMLSFVSAWYQPARFALLPQVVERREYMKANGKLTLVHQMFLTTGWAVGGMLTLWVPFWGILGFVSLSFALSGILVYGIRLRESPTVSEPVGHSEPAWKLLWQSPIIRSITAMDAVEALANAVWTSAILLAFTTEVLGEGAAWWGWINAAYFVGAILGTVLVIHYSDHLQQNLAGMIAASAVSMAIFTALFATLSYPLVSLLLCVCMGPLYQIRDIGQTTILQDTIQSDRRAGVMAARESLLSPWTAVTILLMGLVAERFGVQAAYGLAAGLYACTALLVWAQPELRRYRMVHGRDQSQGVSK